MTAISTKVTLEPAPRVEIEAYPEEKLRCDYGEDVRRLDKVMTDNYGPEGIGWEYRKQSEAAAIGNLVVHAAGDVHYQAMMESRHELMHGSRAR